MRRGRFAADKKVESAKLIDKGDELIKILMKELSKVGDAVTDAQEQMKNLREFGVGVTEADAILARRIIPALESFESFVGNQITIAKRAAS